MDFALITNLLLFLGAMGVTFALDGGGRSSDDEDEDRDAGEAASHRSSFLLHDDDPQTGEDSLAAAAIDRAVREAQARDVVLLAGKGHEDYQEIAGVRRPFSDFDQARAALRRRRGADA